MLQISTGCRFAQPRFCHDLVYRQAVISTAIEQTLYQVEGFLFDAFTAASIATEIFPLELIQGINVFLVDNFPYSLLFTELYKAFQGLA